MSVNSLVTVMNEHRTQVTPDMSHMEEAAGPGWASPSYDEFVFTSDIFCCFWGTDLENEDHIPAQYCWQPAVGPWVSHYAGHIYEERRQTWSERPWLWMPAAALSGCLALTSWELASPSMSILNVSLPSTVELYLFEYFWWCFSWIVCHGKSFDMILCICFLLLLQQIP